VTMPKAWTTDELIEACTQAWLGVPKAAIAQSLGRSLKSVRLKLLAHGFFEPRAFGPWLSLEIVKLRQLIEAEMTWDEIGAALGRKAHAVRYVAYQNGFISKSRRGPQCWACNTFARNPKHMKADGWVSRIRTDTGSFREVYCRDCFAKWGWPEERADVRELLGMVN